MKKRRCSHSLSGWSERKRIFHVFLMFFENIFYILFWVLFLGFVFGFCFVSRWKENKKGFRIQTNVLRQGGYEIILQVFYICWPTILDLVLCISGLGWVIECEAFIGNSTTTSGLVFGLVKQIRRTFYWVFLTTSSIPTVFGLMIGI